MAQAERERKGPFSLPQAGQETMSEHLLVIIVSEERKETYLCERLAVG
jgi:hypothetical protein